MSSSQPRSPGLVKNYNASNSSCTRTEPSMKGAIEVTVRPRLVQQPPSPAAATAATTEPKTNTGVSSSDSTPIKKKCSCVKITCLIITVVAVGAGGFFAYTEFGCDFGIDSACDSSNGIPVGTRFMSIGGTGSLSLSSLSPHQTIAPTTRRLLDSTVTAAATDVVVDELSYALGDIRLCQSVTEDWYDWNGGRYVMYRPDYSSCTTITSLGDTRVTHGSNECATVADRAAKYVNLASQSDMDAKLNISAFVPRGTYRYAEVTFNRYIRVKAAVRMSNGTATKWVYSKQCGAGTCGSVCETAANVRDCRGTITNTAEYKGSSVGQTNSLGDIWRESSTFPTVDLQHLSQSDANLMDTGGYWSRCASDMTVGPSQQIYTKPHNDADSLVVQFLEPLVIDKNATYRLRFAITVDGPVQGSVKPFNTQVGGLGPTNFYGVSDGLYSIELQSMAIAPIVLNNPKHYMYRYEYHVHVRKTATPFCMNDTSTFGLGTAHGFGKCHPCHLWSKTCTLSGNSVNDAVYSVQGMQVDQEFDLKIDVFYSATSLGTVDVTQPRAGSVTVRYNSSVPIARVIDFYLMRVEGMTDSVAFPSQAVNFEENLFGQGRFPRIRDLRLLNVVGATSTVKVMVPANIALCPVGSTLSCGERVNVYFEAPTTLVARHVMDTPAE
jgi:hypothetical protein